MLAGIRLPDSWLAAPITLWRFSRPHTLIGTTTSILGIYAIAADELPDVSLGDGIADLALTVLAGAAVNIYIVGLNQCEDVEIDRVNKPWLPIPAGRLGLRAAWRLVIGSGVLAAGLAVTQGWLEVAAVGAALAVGTAYSSPPLRLKRFPAAAAASISLVRACVVNIGVYLHFARSLGGRDGMSALPDRSSPSRSSSSPSPLPLPFSRTCPTRKVTGDIASRPSPCDLGREPPSKLVWPR